MSYSYIYIYYFGGKITYFISNHQTYLRFFLFLFLVYGKRLVSKVSNENCRLYCEKTSKKITKHFAMTELLYTFAVI